MSLVLQEEFLHRKGYQAMERAAQGGGVVTIPEGVREVAGYGTQCSALVTSYHWSKVVVIDLGRLFQP